MKVPFLDLKAGMRAIREEINEAAAGVFDRCDFVLGEGVLMLEREVAGYVGLPHAVGCASGTDALIIALRALGVEPGDEVITTPVTFVATAEAIHSLGARPLFCDIDPATYNIDPALVQNFISEQCAAAPGGGLVRKASGGRVAGILPVHLFGQCAEMQALNEIAGKYNMFVLEDACQAFGASYEIKGVQHKAGAMGSAAAFSFYPSKNLGGAGDGGMIVTPDAGLAQRCRTLRVHGASRAYEHDESGYNSRLDTLQAAVLCVKLPHVDSWIRARRQVAAAYVRLFQQAAKEKGFDALFSRDMRGCSKPSAGQVVLPSESENCHHSYNVFSIRVGARDAMVEHLRSRDVGTHIYYPIPLHLQKVYSPLGHAAGDFPVSEAVCDTVMALPLYPEITEEHQRFVVESIAEFLTKK